jgi:hypothetical protein
MIQVVSLSLLFVFSLFLYHFLRMSNNNDTTYSDDEYVVLQDTHVGYVHFQKLNGAPLRIGWSCERFERGPGNEAQQSGYLENSESYRHILAARGYKFREIPTQILGWMAGLPEPTGTNPVEDNHRRFAYIKTILKLQ